MLCNQRALSSCEACSRGQAQPLARLPTVQQVGISLRSQLRFLLLFTRPFKKASFASMLADARILERLLHTTISAPCCCVHHAPHRQHKLNHAQPVYLTMLSCCRGHAVVA